MKRPPRHFFFPAIAFGMWLLTSVSGFCSEYSSRLWQMEDGLPHNIVQAIAQTKDGYLWVGTREGLARFDGVRFTSIDFPGDILHPSITSMCVSRSGTLWIGTEGNGLFRWDDKLIACADPNAATNFNVFEIYESGDRAIWIASSLGVLRMAEGRIEIRTDFKGIIQSLCVDREGEVWLAGNGLRHLEATGGIGPDVSKDNLLAEVRKIYCDREGTFWIAVHDGLVEWKQGGVSVTKKGAGPGAFVSAMLKDRKGVLWVGSYGGLSRFVDGRFIDENNEGDASYRIYAIFEDREGSVWIGSEEGLSRLSHKYFKTYTKQQGLSQNSVVTVCAGRDESIWIGVWGGGINRFKNGTVTVLGKKDGLSSDFIMGMCEAADGSLWVGTDYRSGLNRIKDGRITQFGRNEGLMDLTITAVAEDKQGGIWIGARSGLDLFKDGAFTRYTTNDGLSHNKINALCAGHDGAFWIGTEGGLTRHFGGNFFDLAQNDSRLHAAILSLYSATNDVLWIGTKGSGLGRLQGKKLDFFSSKEGLFSDSIYSILEDSTGNLWLNSSKGIFRVSKDQLKDVARGAIPAVTSVNFGKNDGIISSGQYQEVTQPAASKGADGRLWFRTTQGVAVVNPNDIVRNDLPPSVVIEKVFSDKNVVLPSSNRERSSDLDSFVAQTFDLAPGRGELEIHFTALSLRSPEKNRFRYKLAGVDADWVDAGTRRFAYYNKVPPGNYRFQVTACNDDGVWNEAGVEILFKMRPHLWQRKGFIATMILLAAGLLAGSVRYVTRKKLQRKVERLEQLQAVEKERARIARDIHDDLGSRLTKISMLSETMERQAGNEPDLSESIRGIQNTANDMLGQLDEIVWAINPRNDSLERLADYILHYAEEFFSNTSIRCRLKVLNDIPPLLIKAESRHHIFLAVKEALNNVARHSNATEVHLQLEFFDGIFTIRVKDNGSGLDSEASPFGQGLENMRERVKSHGGEFELQSNPNEGTTVRMTFRLMTNTVSDENLVSS